MPPNIEHVVVLMLENRPFDHLFGFFPNTENLSKGDFFNLVDATKQESASNKRIPATAGAPWAIDKGQGPGHSLNGTTVQLFGTKEANGQPAMSGFVTNYRNELIHDRVGHPTVGDLSVAMQSFSQGQLPALSALANEYVLCDHWFSEVPGPTQPNRLYVHAGTSAGYAHNDWTHHFDLATVYEKLSDVGKSWAVYYSDDNEVALFSRINDQRDRFRIYEDSFAADAQNGSLPNYTFIIPRFAAASASQPCNSMHAPQDVRPGDWLIADTYAALRGNDAAWNKTLFIVTFDEHGGFFDHVPPPDAENPDGINSPAPDDRASFAPSFAFDRLGLRVPTIIASPWVGKGVIASDTYQHTSILATVRQLFGCETLTKRDAAAKPFGSLLQATARTDTVKTLPTDRTVAPADTLTLSATTDGYTTDQTIDERVDAWTKIVAGLPKPAGAARISAASLTASGRPRTQETAHQFLKDAVGRYLDYRSKKGHRGK